MQFGDTVFHVYFWHIIEQNINEPMSTFLNAKKY